MQCVIVTVRDWGFSGCYVKGTLKFEGYSVDGELLTSLGYQVNYIEKLIPTKGPGDNGMPKNLEDVMMWPDYVD